MLTITIPSREYFDDEKNEFIVTKEQKLQLEHSLVSLSKWESKWKTPFLTKQKKTIEQTLDYVRCMTITQNVNPNVYKDLTAENLNTINEYIEDPMTASWITEKKKGNKTGEQITSELIYYWMISLNIPMECQKWHLNRLIMLIRVCDAKNETPKKMSKKNIMSQNAALNAARRKKMNSKG